VRGEGCEVYGIKEGGEFLAMEVGILWMCFLLGEENGQGEERFFLLLNIK
jgi:hypothetical protein